MPVKLKYMIWGKTVLNQKQTTSPSPKKLETFASAVHSEADTTQEENTRLLNYFKITQQENSDITGELSNMVANHARAEEGV